MYMINYTYRNVINYLILKMLYKSTLITVYYFVPKTENSIRKGIIIY